MIDVAGQGSAMTLKPLGHDVEAIVDLFIKRPHECKVLTNRTLKTSL